MRQRPTTGYTGYKSVLNGKDAEALGILISLHAPRLSPVILDCTYGLGTMWRGCDYRPDVAADIRPLCGVAILNDYHRMAFADSRFDVVVFDPPHLPVAAASKNSSIRKSGFHWGHRYGITASGNGREGENVIGTFLPFLLEARRILRRDGIVLAKVSDLVHNHRYQWQQVAFVNLCIEAQLTPCDMMIKRNGGNLKSGRWRRQRHLRKSHSYWLVARKGKCEAP